MGYQMSLWWLKLKGNLSLVLDHSSSKLIDNVFYLSQVGQTFRFINTIEMIDL